MQFSLRKKCRKLTQFVNKIFYCKISYGTCPRCMDTKGSKHYKVKFRHRWYEGRDFICVSTVLYLFVQQDAVKICMTLKIPYTEDKALDFAIFAIAGHHKKR